MRCTTQLEQRLRREGFSRIAGVDEAGRGCLFGPVFAAAVILDPGRPIEGLADSKTLAPERRIELAELIRQRSIAWAVASASAAEIDQINIRQASRLAMQRAVASLCPPCDYLLVDALQLDWSAPQQALIKGDAQVACIAAASILAKTERDALMAELDSQFPATKATAPPNIWTRCGAWAPRLSTAAPSPLFWRLCRAFYEFPALAPGAPACPR
jgi:ribonuclease HII